SGNISRDWLKVIVLGNIVTTEESGIIEYSRYVAGYSKVGYEGDERGSADGLHIIYYLLPNTTYVNSVDLVLHSDGGYPRLDTVRSWVEAVNITSLYWMYVDGWDSYGTYHAALTPESPSELKVATFSQGGGTSRVSVYYGRMFKPEMGGMVDMYVDVGYMGGFNIAPQSSYGTGKYTVKLDVGVKQASQGNAVSGQDYETILYMKGGGGWIEMATGFAADRVEDITLDLIADYGVQFIKSPLGKAALKFIPYVAQIIEWAELFWSLTYDDIVNGSRRIVFRDVRVDPRSSDAVYVWTHFVGVTESYLFSANIVNFCGDPPWQSLLEKYFGVDVWRLDYGGVFVGGVLLDYYNVPEVISELPQGEGRSATEGISVKFSKPVDRGSLPPYENSITLHVNGVERPFLEHFRYEVDSNNTTLYIYPNYHLDYESVYIVELTQGIRGLDGTNLLKSYDMWFITEKKHQVGPLLYYVMPTATATSIPDHLTYEGKLFEATYYDNISVREVGLQRVVLHDMVGGDDMKAEYVGEATFYTSDVNIDYYDGGSGRLYLADDVIWFIPFLAWDGGLPPHRGELVFRLGKAVTVVHQRPARILISWLRVGNTRVEKTLRDAGVVEGALLDLEPVPVMNYLIISALERVGEGVIISKSEPSFNGTRLSMYLVTTIDRQVNGLDEVLGGYVPMYKGLGGMPVDGDLFVFLIVNVTYMRAWRLTPLGYVPQEEQSKIYTYTIKLSDLGPAEITVITNTTVREIDESSLPQEIKLIVEGTPGSSGYIIITIPKQLNMTVKSATIDGKPVEVEALNQSMFSGVVGARLTYRHTQRSSTVTITLSKEAEPITQPTTTAEQPTQLPLTLLLVVIVIAAVTLTLVKLKDFIR
ncbi:MAG: Ig-like domain-containing protein, partial [Zestosphaera sp.]